MRHELTAAPLTLFYSYAHEDEPLRQQLENHLSLLRRQGLISEWHDRQIVAGTEWVQEIDTHLETASIILLLISPDFLASNYCYDIEMHRALERHGKGEVYVVPIILRPCDWRNAPFVRLLSLPSDGKPVTKWDTRLYSDCGILRENQLRERVNEWIEIRPSEPERAEVPGYDEFDGGRV